MRATRGEMRELIALSTALALEDCFSILPTSAAAPEHVAHLTSLRVMQVETELRDLLTARKPQTEQRYRDVSHVTARLGQQFDAGQLDAAAAGSGKTTMLATAIAAANDQGRRVRVVAPTKRAADVAHQDLGVAAASVAALVHAHGYRWNEDGVWTRLTPGATDSATGATFIGPPPTAVMRLGDRIVVDEARMLDQDAALALFTVAAEAGATVALVGDRAQLGRDVTDRPPPIDLQVGAATPLRRQRSITVGHEVLLGEMRFFVDSHPTRRTSPVTARPADRHQPHETQQLVP